MGRIQNLFKDASGLATKIFRKDLSWNRHFEFSDGSASRIHISIEELETGKIRIIKQNVKLAPAPIQTISLTMRPSVAMHFPRSVESTEILHEAADKGKVTHLIEESIPYDFVSMPYESWASKANRLFPVPSFDI